VDLARSELDIDIIASDLGWVTERWLAEYRANQVADSK
jgi:hypothetical protein